jgi:hypothetical protein
MTEPSDSSSEKPAAIDEGVLVAVVQVPDATPPPLSPAPLPAA